MEKRTRDKALIIFFRNPQLGQVKTRLAASVGDAAALAIYLELAAHTRVITGALPVDKVVFYSDHIDTEDHWPNVVFRKALQAGNDLGQKMEEAFRELFSSGYTSVCVIGTDCYELTEDIVLRAFESLDHSEVVIGPAADGGYYLLGTRALHPALFHNKPWSSDRVLNETIRNLKELGLSYTTLPLLRDVDTESDLPDNLRKLTSG
ncbi:MAG TPA: TIGR04282 family arsenosugar biosynthesis glycosyltransferase [Ohtaekwangia sp.]|nr:TIGR04282 family arsenosugar biosynthesis glycosyltransferase [Ohtaekwangia sp.]